MRISVLGSGSKGNATLLQFDSTTVMVDCGFGIRETTKRLALMGLQPQDIDTILVTHEHQDHIHGVEPFAAKYQMSVRMTAGTARVWKSRGRVTAELIHAGRSFKINDLEVLPVAVPHDAREPVQFVFSYKGQKVGVLTDLGSLTPHVVTAYEGCHTLLIEANHDEQMLRNGPYPATLKRRVAGNWGHLNNTQTAEFITRVNTGQSLRNLIVGHISEQNNQIDLAARALGAHSASVENIVYASQDQPLDWIKLD